MDFNIEVRKKQLQSLDQYITSSKDKVQSILEYLRWNSKEVLETETKVTCSMNPNHRVPFHKYEEHLNKCYFNTLGYDTSKDMLSEPVHDATASIKLDKAKKLEVLSRHAHNNNQKFKAAWNGQECDPMTSDRFFSTFSTDERLALYEYCIDNTEGPPAPSEFNLYIDDKKDETLLTEEELLAKQRDAKRRRIKYKSVHTDRNKSHTEIIKQVIENQMDMYKEYLTSLNHTESSICPSDVEQNGDQNRIQHSSNENTYQHIQVDHKEKSDQTERPHSSVSRHSAHSGSSRTKRDYEYSKQDDRKRYKEYTRNRDKHDYNPYSEKRRKYTDHKDSREYSRDRRNRNYRPDYRH